MGWSSRRPVAAENRAKPAKEIQNTESAPRLTQVETSRALTSGHRKRAGPSGPAPSIHEEMRSLRYGVAQNSAVLASLEDALGLALQLPDPLA
jgi:hypothetical protein